MPTLSFGGRSHLVVIDGVKGPSKIKVTDINCEALVQHARHRFLEDQEIGETGPTG